MTCRELIKLGAVAGVSAMAGRLGAVEPAVKPLRILILGGTGFTGPHSVRYVGLELVTSFGLTNALQSRADALRRGRCATAGRETDELAADRRREVVNLK